MTKTKRVFYFAFLADGNTVFDIRIEGINKRDAEKRLLRNLTCLEQLPNLCRDIDLEIDE